MEQENGAVYCRLSQDDGSAGESGSIQTQRKILLKYATDNGFSNPTFFIDDGISGVTFDRPGWNEMIRLAEVGKVTTVIVKDMQLKADRKALDSRLGEIENTIKADMGEAENGSCGLFRISWKSQTRQTFQAKEFAKDHPDLDLTPYYKNTNLRPFKVTEQNLTEAV